MATSFSTAYIRSNNAPDADPELEKKPNFEPSQDANTVSDQRRLSGAKGLSYLKERKT